MAYADPERRRSRQTAWRIENLEYARQRDRQYRDKNRAASLVNNARGRATKSNIPFSLTIEHVQAGLDRGTCAVSGIPFVHGDHRGPWSASLDRVVPELGYTDENTQVVCWAYNAAKSAHTHEDVLRLAHALVTRNTDDQYLRAA